MEFPQSFDDPAAPTGKAHWSLKRNPWGQLEGSAYNFIGLEQEKVLDKRPDGYVTDKTHDASESHQLLQLDAARFEMLQQQQYEELDLLQCCADMLYPWSGRAGFERLQLGPGETAPPRDIMAAMLEYESKLRLSKEVQDKLSSCYDHKDIAGLFRQKVYQEVQLECVRAFGLEDEYGLRVLRSVESNFPGDKPLHDLSYYRKYNRSKPCEIKIGTTAPPVPLHALSDGTEAPLAQHLAGCHRAVLIAGSAS